MLSSKNLYCEKMSNGLPVIGVPVKMMLYLLIRPKRCKAYDCDALGVFILLLSSQTIRSGFHFVISLSNRQQLS